MTTKYFLTVISVAAILLGLPALASPEQQKVDDPPADTGGEPAPTPDDTQPAQPDEAAEPAAPADAKTPASPATTEDDEDDEDEDEDELRYGPVPAKAPSAIKNIKRGRKLYKQKCKDCHGSKADGKGSSAYFMDPRPRNLLRGSYKFRSTESGSLPTDRDIYRTLTKGLPGTSMPGWSGLSSADRWALVGYLKSLSPRFKEEADEPLRPLRVGAPTPDTDEAVERGERLYTQMKCGDCHGASGRGDGPSAKTLKDDVGRRIYPFDMTQKWKLKTGSRARDIVRALSTGLDGTPMPSYVDSLTPEQAWDLARYVRSMFASPD